MNEPYLLAAILGPCLSFTVVLMTLNNKLVDLLKSALEKMVPQTPLTHTAFEVEEITEPSTKKKSLFNFMQESDTSSSQIQPNDLSKIDDYFEAPATDMSMDLA